MTLPEELAESLAKLTANSEIVRPISLTFAGNCDMNSLPFTPDSELRNERVRFGHHWQGY